MFDLALTPAGRLIPVDSIADSAEHGREGNRLLKAFVSSEEGLFLLAAEKWEMLQAPAVLYWREFGVRYLTALCHTPEASYFELESLPAPSAAELGEIVLSAPPMRGAEYLTPAMLESLWKLLDLWVRREAGACSGGLSVFLKERAPLWHQVGRVCFHLAENRLDPELPFAFIATYIPGLSRAPGLSTSR